MLQPKDVNPGTELLLHLPDGPQRMTVVSIKDGRVVFRMARPRRGMGRYRWWMPWKTVKQIGELLR